MPKTKVTPNWGGNKDMEWSRKGVQQSAEGAEHAAGVTPAVRAGSAHWRWIKLLVTLLE